MVKLVRVSTCCHAPVCHVLPINSRTLEEALRISCTRCWETTSIVLIDPKGDVVWESPEKDGEENA